VYASYVNHTDTVKSRVRTGGDTLIMSTLKQTSSFFIGKLENAFLRWGKFVSRYPYLVILLSIIVTAISALGFLNFRIESKANLLWIPPDSKYNEHQRWLEANFEKDTREEVVVFEAENVLTPESLQKVLNGTMLLCS